MQSDVTQIKRDGETVTMPLSLYEEVRSFCRRHGESDLPGFAEFGVVEPEADAIFSAIQAQAENPATPKFRKLRGDGNSSAG